MLKYKDVRYKQVNVWELGRYFEKVYGVDPEIVSSEEWRNDSCHIYRVDGDMTQEAADRAARLVAGEYQVWGVCYLVLQVLVAGGHLDPGDYLIESVW